MGAAMARTLAANGATVFVLGRRSGPLEETAKAAADEGATGTIHAIQCDVTSKDNLEAAAEKVKEKTPFVDALVLSSGSPGPPLPFPMGPSGPNLEALQEALWETPMEDFTATYNANITGAFYTSVAFLQLLAAANAKDVRTPSRPRPRELHLATLTTRPKLPSTNSSNSCLISSYLTIFGATCSARVSGTRR
jgi:NAD(P)-dependent dehydrogenase (short-subunit alcohol dehydrogenase family)